MHISDTIKTNPSSSLEDWQAATTETVNAFARQVSARNPEKTYLPEAENLNCFKHNRLWQHKGQFEFIPTLKTPSHIGFVQTQQKPLFITPFQQRGFSG